MQCIEIQTVKGAKIDAWTISKNDRLQISQRHRSVFVFIAAASTVH